MDAYTYNSHRIFHGEKTFNDKIYVAKIQFFWNYGFYFLKLLKKFLLT